MIRLKPPPDFKSKSEIQEYLSKLVRNLQYTIEHINTEKTAETADDSSNGNTSNNITAKKNLSMAACGKSMSADLSLVAGTITTVPIDSVTSSNSEIICSDGGIKCPYDGTIIVSGNIYYSAHGGTYSCFIYKNDTEIISQAMTSTNAWRSITSGAAIVSVSAGDIIYLKSRSVGGNGTVVCNNTGTQLNIAYV